MKKIITVLFFHFSLFTFHAFAQQGEWTWITGSSGNNGAPTYGTLGVFAANNTPASMYESCGWTDAQGKLWLFGGLKDFGTEYNTFWQFDPVIAQWARMGGSTTAGATGTYGTQGIPSVNNIPGARAWGAYTWVDNDGMFWLYGGLGNNLGGFVVLNDLWMFNPNTLEWTWITGSSNDMIEASYGVKGIASATNTPGARCEANATWVDDENNLWLFGGGLYSGTPGSWSIQGFGNDLWKFDRSINQWIWVSGTTVMYAAAVYGTKGVPDINNIPSGRGSYASFRDASENFYLFAGYNLGSAWNDIWRYNPTTNEWTWLNGPNTVNGNPVTGVKCITDSLCIPSNRYENRTSWQDKNGDFWTWGGVRSDFSKLQNDLWKYTVSTNRWTFISGDINANGAASYGVKGISDPLNVPPAKFGGMAWVDAECNFWVFGGSKSNSGAKNDMWRYVPDPTCPVQNICAVNQLPSAGFSSTDTAFCESTCINYYDQSTGNPTSWEWIFTGGTPSTSPLQNPINICYSTAGTYDVTLIVINANGTDTFTLTGLVTVNASPTVSISAAGNILTASVANSYQWYLDGTLIPGATSQSYTVLQGGVYTVVVTDANGCTASADYLYPSINFNAADVTLCEKFCTNYFDQSLNNPISWNWAFEGASPSTSTQQNPTNICYQDPGTFDVTLITTDGLGNKDTLVLNSYITVYSNPFAPTISQIGNTLTSSSAYTYQWQLNSVDISGATNQSYTISQSGLYTVIVTDENGCASQASFQAIISGIENAGRNISVSIFPNPSSGIYNLEIYSGNNGEMNLEITNALGQIIFMSNEKITLGKNDISIDLSNFASGVYILRLNSADDMVALKMIHF